MTKGLKNLLFITSITFALAGCRTKVAPGHYEGNLIWINYSGAVEQPVGIDIAYSQRKAADVWISDPHGNSITSFSLSKFSRHGFDLIFPSLYPRPFHLKEVSKEAQGSEITCYQARETWTAEVCFDQQRFSLRIFDEDRRGVFKLLGDTFLKEPDLVLEAPTQLTLEKAIRRALGANLESRISFERVIQAKHTVTSAYLNLIPHLTTNLIWNADFGYISAIATLQGLAPFVLPTYWLQARETQYDLKFKRDAETILKADLAAMVEQLAYAFDRDTEILQIQQKAINVISSFLVEVRNRESQGGLPHGTADLFSPFMSKLASDQEKTLQLVVEDRYTISQALGFHNPEGVEKVVLPAVRISTPVETLDKTEFARLASHRSFELRQMDYLKKIAHLKKIELYFAWIDPTGDPKSGFGFNTIPQLKVASSQARELALRREQVQQTIYQNTYRIADQYNATLNFVNQAVFRGDPDPDLTSLLNDSLREGFTPAKLVNQIDELLSKKIGFVANLAAYRITKSKVDRNLLSGYYEFLLPLLEQADVELKTLL